MAIIRFAWPESTVYVNEPRSDRLLIARIITWQFEALSHVTGNSTYSTFHALHCLLSFSHLQSSIISIN